MVTRIVKNEAHGCPHSETAVCNVPATLKCSEIDCPVLYGYLQFEVYHKARPGIIMQVLAFSKRGAATKGRRLLSFKDRRLRDEPINNFVVVEFG